MKLTKFGTTLAAIGLTSVLLLTGCQSAGGGKITVGKIDTATLLQDDPDYQSLSISYLQEQTDLRKSFVDRVKSVGDDRAKIQKLQAEMAKTEETFNQKWQKKTEEFLRTRHSSIQDTAGEIAKRKKIDMVVIDSKQYPTVEWGGVDMTKDMALALSTKDSPQATSTPEGK